VQYFRLKEFYFSTQGFFLYVTNITECPISGPDCPLIRNAPPDDRGTAILTATVKLQFNLTSLLAVLLHLYCTPDGPHITDITTF